MKLTYIANVRLPTEKAHGIQIMKMCESFAKTGAKVTLIAPFRIQPDPKLRTQDSFKYYGASRNFRIKTLPCIDLIWLEDFLGKWTYWVQELTFSLAVFLYELFHGEDVVYTRDDFVAAGLARFKKVVFEAYVWPEKGHFWYSSWMPKLKSLVVISNTLKKKYEQWFPANKILVAHDGVDLKAFAHLPSKSRARKMLGMPQNKQIAIYTGHLYPWKGVDTIIRAASLIPSCLFYIVGGTHEDIEKYRSVIEKAKLKNVTLVGHVPPTKVPRYLAASDVLLLPNSAKYKISKEYTSPLKLFEYMAAKRPILASDVPSSREILKDGKNAVLFKADNAEDFAKKLSRLFAQRKLSVNTAAKAYKDVQAYSWDRRSRSILRFIQG